MSAEISRNRFFGWLVFGVGLVLGLVGYLTDMYSVSMATGLMLGVWLIGGGLVAVLFPFPAEEAPERELKKLWVW